MDVNFVFTAKFTSKEREQQIIRWLDTIKVDAEAIYLVGDVFDFWFEYKTVVPKGYVRLLGKLAELRDSGMPVYFFTGNHDMWMFGYFVKPLWGAGLGVVFIIGRFIYRAEYLKDPGSRSPGFMITFLPTAVMLIWVLVALVRMLF